MLINDFEVKANEFLFCNIKNLVYFETSNSLTIRFNDTLRIKMVVSDSSNIKQYVKIFAINKNCGEIDNNIINFSDFSNKEDFIEYVNQYIYLWK